MADNVANNQKLDEAELEKVSAGINVQNANPSVGKVGKSEKALPVVKKKEVLKRKFLKKAEDTGTKKFKSF